MSNEHPKPSSATAGATARPRPAPRRIEVLRIEPLSPHMVRITFTGPELHNFVWSGPAAHVKLIVPEEGSHTAPMPQPEQPRSPNMRTYTPRHFDSNSAQLDIDFMLHAHGPAGRWASRAQIGDELVIMGPAPGYKIDADAEWFVLAGDGTSLPAIETILAGLPAHARAHVLVEVVDQREARALKSAAQIEVLWLALGDDSQQAGTLLENAVRKLLDNLPSGNGRFYVGCESMAMRRIRRLLKERGIDRSAMITRGYWRLGSANHPDGDFGDDT